MIAQCSKCGESADVAFLQGCGVGPVTWLRWHWTRYHDRREVAA